MRNGPLFFCNLKIWWLQCEKRFFFFSSFSDENTILYTILLLLGGPRRPPKSPIGSAGPSCEYRLVWESEFSGVGKRATGDFNVVLQVAVGLVLGRWNLQPNPFARSMIPYYYRCLSTAKSQFWFWELLEITFLIQKSFAFFFYLVNWMYKASNWLEKRRNYFLLEILWTKSNILKLEGPKSNLHQVSRTKNIIYYVKKIVILIASKLHFNP